MAANRKTVDRDIIIKRMNSIAKSNQLTAEEKLLILTFAESILVKGDAYDGYVYEHGTPDVISLKSISCRKYI